MADSTDHHDAMKWLWWFPPARWIIEYRAAWLLGDIVAGVTLAAYAIPVSLAYAGLAGLPPQVGVYGYLLGGLGYALLGSSRQLAIGPTSAISLRSDCSCWVSDYCRENLSRSALSRSRSLLPRCWGFLRWGCRRP